MTTSTTIGVQDKILHTAEQLIYRNGIHAMGMDLLVRTSGVARKSIYRYYATKEDVAVQALSARDVRWMHWLRAETDKAQGTEARILALFDVLKGWFASEGFRGCAFINTAGEIGDPADPIRQLAKTHKLKLLEYLLELCEPLKVEQPEPLARQLLLLIDGAITLALVIGDPDAADNARHMAQLLLESTRKKSAHPT